MRAGVAGRQERGQIQTQYLLMEKIKHERSAQNHMDSLATGLSRILGGRGRTTAGRGEARLRHFLPAATPQHLGCP